MTLTYRIIQSNSVPCTAPVIAFADKIVAVVTDKAAEFIRNLQVPAIQVKPLSPKRMYVSTILIWSFSSGTRKTVSTVVSCR